MARSEKYTSDFLESLLGELDPLDSEMVKNKMLIAVRIAKGIEKRNLTKSKFAKLLGRQPSEVTKWLSGTHNFTVDLLTEIGKELDIQFFVESPLSHPVEVPLKVVSKAVLQEERIASLGEPNKFLFRFTTQTNSKVQTKVYGQAV